MIEERLRENLRAEAAALPPAPAGLPEPRRRLAPMLVAAAAAAVVLVAVGGAALVLLRSAGPGPDDAIVELPEGTIEWTSVDPGLTGFNAGGIVHGPAGFVIAADAQERGEPGAAAISADGTAWDVVAVEAFRGYQLMALAGGESGYVALGLGSPQATEVQSPDIMVWHSADGREWAGAALTIPPLPDGVSRGEAFPHGLVATGDLVAARAVYLFEPGTEPGGLAAQDLLWVSRDAGRTWDLSDAGGFGAEASLAHLAAGPAGLLAVADSAQGTELWLSADGSSWATTAGPGPDVRWMVGGAHGYLAVVGSGRGSQVWWSADGGGWEPVLLFEGAFVTVMEGSASGFVVGTAAVPEDPENVQPWDLGYTLHYSADGVVWRPVATPDDLPTGFVSDAGITVGAGRIVAAGFPGPLDQLDPAAGIGPIVLVGSPAG